MSRLKGGTLSNHPLAIKSREYHRLRKLEYAGVVKIETRGRPRGSMSKNKVVVEVGAMSVSFDLKPIQKFASEFGSNVSDINMLSQAIKNARKELDKLEEGVAMIRKLGGRTPSPKLTPRELAQKFLGTSNETNNGDKNNEEKTEDSSIASVESPDTGGVTGDY